MHHLVGTAEIAALLGVSRQRVDQLTREADFPAPTVVLRVGRVWKASDVERWKAARDERRGQG